MYLVFRVYNKQTIESARGYTVQYDEIYLLTLVSGVLFIEGLTYCLKRRPGNEFFRALFRDADMD